MLASRGQTGVSSRGGCLDQRQAVDAREIGVHWAGVLTLERVHAYDPLPRLEALGLKARARA